MAIALGSLLFWATMSGLTFLVTASDSDTLINEEEANKILEDRKKELDKINISPGPIGGKEPTADTLRWPADGIDVNTDYVFFQFGKYIPPFGKDTTADSPMIAWNQYQASTKLKPEGPGILLK